jgi:UDP-N-acetylmuramoyl-tripeptide--D-alanyl-D-alanine ligase
MAKYPGVKLHRAVQTFWSVCAMIWRRILFRTTVIAVTGSAGKSTTTALLGEILSRHYSTNWIPGARNSHANLVETLLGTRWHHKYTLIELGTREPGTLPRLAWLVSPDIVVVTCVLHLHSNCFPRIDDVAKEKASLPAHVGSKGTVFLNADDFRVAAMASRCRAEVKTFGQVEGATLRTSNIESAWPERLTLQAHADRETAAIRSQLIGEHMSTPIAAALAVAVHCGVALHDAAKVIEAVEPVNGRLRPMSLPNGAIVWRDDHNASVQTLEVALQALARAKATRRIAIIGDVIDSDMTKRQRMRYLARRVAESSDYGIFLGREFAKVARGEAMRHGMDAEALQGYTNWWEISSWLRTQSQPGDLILLHCWMKHHIERAVLEQFGEIACHLPDCRIVARCEDCEHLGLVRIQAT